MKRPIRLFALVALVAAVAGCSQAAGSLGDAPSTPRTAAPSIVPTAIPSANPTARPTSSPSPSESAIDADTVLAADGIGPYSIGARLSGLESRALVTNVQPSFNCDDSWQSAEATGRYAGQVTFTFHLGRLIDINSASAELVAPSGARVGMPLSELQRIYGGRGSLLTGASGNQALAVRVRDTDLGIVFYLDEANTKALSMSAGEVQRLEQTAIVGEGC